METLRPTVPRPGLRDRLRRLPLLLVAPAGHEREVLPRLLPGLLSTTSLGSFFARPSLRRSSQGLASFGWCNLIFLMWVCDGLNLSDGVGGSSWAVRWAWSSVSSVQ